VEEKIKKVYIKIDDTYVDCDNLQQLLVSSNN